MRLLQKLAGGEFGWKSLHILSTLWHMIGHCYVGYHVLFYQQRQKHWLWVALAVGCSAAAKGWSRFRVCMCVRMCVSTHLQYIITSSTFYQNNSLSLISTSTCMSVECILEVLMHSGGKNKGELTFLEARGALLYFFSPNNDRDTWVLSCVPHCKEDTWKHSFVQVFWCSKHEIPLNCWPLVVGVFHAMLY